MLSDEAMECADVIELLKSTGLLSTVTSVGSYHAQLVREFIVNLPDQVDDATSPHFQKVVIRNKIIDFSPKVIHEFMGSNAPTSEDQVPSRIELISELTGGKDKKGWPESGLYRASLLSSKYSVLHKIGVKNWIPTAHSTGVSLALAQFLFMIGTGRSVDVGKLFYSQIIKHAGSEAIKLPIPYPAMITGIILRQQPDILSPEEMKACSSTPGKISFSYKLFQKHHVADIKKPPQSSLPHARFNDDDAPAVPPMSADVRKLMALSLVDEIKHLETVIATSTERKMALEDALARILPNASSTTPLPST